MKCPYCRSSTLIWDYERGEVICPNCGSVIERIYVSSTYFDLNDEGDAEKSLRSEPKLKPITKLYLKFIHRSSILRKSKVKVNKEALLRYLEGKGPHVKIFKKPFNENKLRDEVINKIINIMNKYPRLKSRTDRAKLALALIAVRIASGENINNVVTTIRKDTALSLTHIKRLMKLVVLERRFIEEVRTLLQN